MSALSRLVENLLCNAPLVIPGLPIQTQCNIQFDPPCSSTYWSTTLIGKKLSGKHSDTTFAEQFLPDNTRIHEPDGIILADWEADRLNVDVDEEGNVEKIWCG